MTPRVLCVLACLALLGSALLPLASATVGYACNPNDLTTCNPSTEWCKMSSGSAADGECVLANDQNTGANGQACYTAGGTADLQCNNNHVCDSRNPAAFTCYSTCGSDASCTSDPARTKCVTTDASGDSSKSFCSAAATAGGDGELCFVNDGVKSCESGLQCASASTTSGPKCAPTCTSAEQCSEMAGHSVDVCVMLTGSRTQGVCVPAESFGWGGEACLIKDGQAKCSPGYACNDAGICEQRSCDVDPSVCSGSATQCASRDNVTFYCEYTDKVGGEGDLCYPNLTCDEHYHCRSLPRMQIESLPAQRHLLADEAAVEYQCMSSCESAAECAALPEHDGYVCATVDRYQSCVPGDSEEVGGEHGWCRVENGVRACNQPLACATSNNATFSCKATANVGGETQPCFANLTCNAHMQCVMPPGASELKCFSSCNNANDCAQLPGHANDVCALWGSIQTCGPRAAAGGVEQPCVTENGARSCNAGHYCDAAVGMCLPTPCNIDPAVCADGTKCATRDNSTFSCEAAGVGGENQWCFANLTCDAHMQCVQSAESSYYGCYPACINAADCAQLPNHEQDVCGLYGSLQTCLPLDMVGGADKLCMIENGVRVCEAGLQCDANSGLCRVPCNVDPTVCTGATPVCSTRDNVTFSCAATGQAGGAQQPCMLVGSSLSCRNEGGLTCSTVEAGNFVCVAPTPGSETGSGTGGNPGGETGSATGGQGGCSGGCPAGQTCQDDQCVSQADIICRNCTNAGGVCERSPFVGVAPICLQRVNGSPDSCASNAACPSDSICRSSKCVPCTGACLSLLNSPESAGFNGSAIISLLYQSGLNPNSVNVVPGSFAISNGAVTVGADSLVTLASTDAAVSQLTLAGSTPGAVLITGQRSIGQLQSSTAGNSLMISGGLKADNVQVSQGGSLLISMPAGSASTLNLSAITLSGPLNLAASTGSVINFPSAANGVTVNGGSVSISGNGAGLTGNLGSAPLSLVATNGVPASIQTPAGDKLALSGDVLGVGASIDAAGEVDVSSLKLEPNVNVAPGGQLSLNTSAASATSQQTTGDISLGSTVAPSSVASRSLLAASQSVLAISGTTGNTSYLQLGKLASCPSTATIRYNVVGYAQAAIDAGITVFNYASSTNAATAAFTCAIEVCGTEGGCVAVTNPKVATAVGARRLLAAAGGDAEWQATKLTIKSKTAGPGNSAAAMAAQPLLLLALAFAAVVAVLRM